MGEWHDIHAAWALQGPQRGRKTDTHPNHHRVAHNRAHDRVAHYRTCHNGTCYNGTDHHSTDHHSTNHLPLRSDDETSFPSWSGRVNGGADEPSLTMRAR